MSRKARKSTSRTTKKASRAKTKSKRTQKEFEVPEVIRSKSMVDLMSYTIKNDEDASEKVQSLPKKDLKYIFDLMNAIIFGHVSSGGKVQFMPYITYEPAVRLPRKGRNPQTGEEIQIKGQLGFRSRAGKGLKDMMNADEKLVERLVAERQAEKAEKEKAKASRKAKGSPLKKRGRKSA